MSARRSRIIVMTVVLASCASAWIAWSLQPRVHSDIVPFVASVASPPMDISNEDVRITAGWLMSGPINHDAGSWLGAVCHEATGSTLSSPETYIFSRDEFFIEENSPIARTYVIHVDSGGAGWFYADFWPMQRSQSSRPTTSRRAVLAPDEVKAFRSLLDSGGYWKLAPGGAVGACHSEITTLESCREGKYYGVMRMCEHVDSTEQPAPLRKLADRLERLLALRLAQGSQPVVGRNHENSN